jgi:hypothetical protein
MDAGRHAEFENGALLLRPTKTPKRKPTYTWRNC